MTQAHTVQRHFHVTLKRKGHKELVPGEAPRPVKSPKIPRVARLMALAIRFDRLIREGHVKDQAELAKLGHVTRARLSQIMNLLMLAPDIQETILLLDPTTRGEDRIKERDLRPIAAMPDWRKQRRMIKAVQE